MNATVPCRCGTKLKLPAQPVKALKCPKCGQVVRTAPGAVDARPAPSAAQLSLVCPACQKKLKVGSELAGKNIKCPGCSKVFKAAPPAAASNEEEWLDVNEAAAPPEPAAAPARGAPAGDWGQDLFKGHGVPEDMQEKIRTTLTAGERLLWLDRPRMDILLHKARLVQIKGILLGLVGAFGGPAGAYYLYYHVPGLKHPQNLIVAGILLVLAVILGLVGIYSIFVPMLQRRGARARACFALTNRRLLIHPGTGAQMMYDKKGGVNVVVGAGKLGVISYSGFELAYLQRVEEKRFKGCGNLVFGRTLLDNPSGGQLWALGNVAEVEKKLRETLIHPIMDKLLRGQGLSPQEKGDGKTKPGSKSEGEVMPAGQNIKDFVAAGSNIKDARVGIEQDLKKVPADQREQVKQEMTEGEKILWIGQPERSQKGKGSGGGILRSLGQLVGMEDRREPEYFLYALTSRRVLLWARKNTSTELNPSLIGPGLWEAPRGPLSYYPPHLKDAGVEEDKQGAGSIIFKITKVVHQITGKDNRGKTQRKTHVQVHYFGILHVRKYLELARLLHATLIAPCRGL